MEDVRKALAVSVAARAVSAVSGLLALPIYLRYLGVEAYGVVGLFASLQVLVAFMDLGLSATVTRQLARISGNPAQLRHGRDIVRTFELAYFALAAVIGVLLVCAAPLIAKNWVNLDSLSATQVTRPLQLAGLSLACGWPANLYGAGLAGLHRQVPLALSTSGFTILRVVLSVIFLGQAPTLESFFWAQIAASLLQSFGTGMQLWRELALRDHQAKPRWEVIGRTKRFAGGMTAITVTSIVLSQMDKVILSHLLSLPDFGAYVVAGTLGTSLFILISPVFSVIYPRMAALWAAGDHAGLAGLYHASSQAMAALVFPVAAVLVCFPVQSLFVLTDNRLLSEQASLILVFLALGATLNGVMNIPYALLLAAGWTSLSVWINLVAIGLLVPATWWAAVRYGAVGGAAVWALLNLLYLVVSPQLLHGRLLTVDKRQWYWHDVLVPAFASLSVALLIGTQVQPDLDSRWWVAVQLALFWLVSSVVTVGMLPHLRTHLARILRE